MDLKLGHYNNHGIEVVDVEGQIDIYTAPRLRELLIDLFEKGNYQLVVNMEKVEFLDSTGLGVLVGGLKRVRAHDGSLDLVCTQERILRIFRITGLTRVFGIHEKVNEAIEARRPSRKIRQTAPLLPDSATADETELHIYLADGSQHAAVQSALDSVLADHGVADLQWEDPKTGSWYRRGKAKAAVEELERIAVELRRAAELQVLDIPQSTVDANQGHAVAEILAALSEERDAVIQIGSILLVKSDGIPVVRNLTQFELAALQRNPTWLTEPSRILQAVQDANRHTEPVGTIRAEPPRPLTGGPE